VGAEVHVCEVHPDKNWLACFVLPLDEIDRPVGNIIVDGYHPALGQRTRVRADLLANLAEARVNGRVVLVRGFTVHHAARSELGTERRVFRVIRQFRLFFGIEVIQVPVELVKPIGGLVVPITAKAEAKPNIVIIWGDDIGLSDVSAYSMGLMGFHTPNNRNQEQRI
jgi:hypothetical protein